MDLESAAKREVAIHSHAHHVASLQLGCGCAANIGLKRDVVYKISGELETIDKNLHAATQDAQLQDFIPEAVSTGNPQVSEVGLGDFYFSGEAIVAPCQPQRPIWLVHWHPQQSLAADALRAGAKCRPRRRPELAAQSPKSRPRCLELAVQLQVRRVPKRQRLTLQ